MDNETRSLRKCPTCNDIKFYKEILHQIEKQVIENYKMNKRSSIGRMIKNLYIFGGYLKDQPQCGDIDVLVTYDMVKLKQFIRAQVRKFHNQFYVRYLPDFTLSMISKVSEESFWDFRTCSDYPDCLSCFEEEECTLPPEDYHSEQHRYCLEECQINPTPSCCFHDCVFLQMGFHFQTLNAIADVLKAGTQEFLYDKTTRLKVKVLDIILKATIKEIETEFQHSDQRKRFQLYKVDPISGQKKCVRNRMFGGNVARD
ncbi:MAG: hypothetical protein HWN65_22860 [Candidatus Helarchaeota archaeon]|nr:hypothetical protein [Candidatus Helarchaeota archaeon]